MAYQPHLEQALRPEDRPPAHDRYMGPANPWAGWLGFGSVMLTLLGLLSMLQGLLALFDDSFFVARTESDLLLVDYTAWGVVMLLWGLLLVIAGLSLGAGRPWARWFALLIASVNVIAQIGFLSAYPIWSAIMILFDVLVIFALTARWDEARPSA
jgi:hypothetical protein